MSQVKYQVVCDALHPYHRFPKKNLDTAIKARNELDKHSKKFPAIYGLCTPWKVRYCPSEVWSDMGGQETVENHDQPRTA